MAGSVGATGATGAGSGVAQALRHTAALRHRATRRDRVFRWTRRNARWKVSTGMGQFDAEMGAVARGQQLDSAAVRSNVLVHDGQTDTGASDRVRGLAFTPVKRFKNAVAVGLGHARSLVDHIETGPAGVVLQ